MREEPLGSYNRKRDFRLSPEPRGRRTAARGAGSFVIQKHAARNLHYDFRLEWDGVLRSWAVPKGPSLDPAVKRMAVEVEDHPLSYGAFEGVIPPGHYGAGSVSVWDRGTWQPIGDARKGFRDGRLKFQLAGRKLKGAFALIRMRSREGEKRTSWLLIKERDSEARASADFDVLEDTATAVPAPRRPGRKRSPPLALAPQLATLVAAPPAEGDWLYELKLDGYRLLTRVSGKDVRCFTRNGHDWSRRLPGIVQAVRELGMDSGWLDGEIVVLDEQGAPDFQRLQNAFEADRTSGVRYIVFDLPFHQGEDLREHSLRERRERLHGLLDEASGTLRFSATVEGEPGRVLAAARAAGFEGLIGKRADASYRSGRGRDWIKLKVGQRQEFVIGGFTEPQGSRTGLGSLLLGVHDAQGRLRYAGNVGSGFDRGTLDALRTKLEKLRTSRAPFEEAPRRVGAGSRVVPHWVKPKLVAEVSFAEWTAAGQVRQAVFQGLRSDKPPEKITREIPLSAAAGKPEKRPLPKGLRVTHPDRVIDAASGTTKGDLVVYYAQVAPLLLPHLADRPVSLLRAPQGVGKPQFFQKHAEARTLPLLDRLPRSLDPGHAPLLAIPSKEALLSAAQMNVVELHTWNATTASINRPDRMVFDLDPGEGVDWTGVKQAARLLHSLLEELELTSFLKTSGGKGLHVVVPLRPELQWEPVKAFSRQLVEHLARVIPQRFVAKSGPRNRVGRVFVDYLRNGRGATTVAAWSARARPGMGISVPLSWDELAGFSQRPPWTVRDCADRISTGNSPWKAYQRSRQTLAAAMDKLGFQPSRAPARKKRKAPQR